MSDLGLGTHHVTVFVAADSARVHVDEGMLSGAYTWTVEVSDKGLGVKGPAAVPAEAGKPVSFTLSPAEGAAPAKWRLPNPPEGATFDEATGAFAWTPAGTHAGAWRLEFETRAGERFWTHSIPVTVAAPGHSSSAPPKILFQPPVSGREGKALEFRLLAYDADGEWKRFGLHVAESKALAALQKRLEAAPPMVRLTEHVRLLRDSDSRVWGAAQEGLKRIFADCAAASDEPGRTWPLDHFFEEMPRRVWQFADRPAGRGGAEGLCAAIAAIPGLPAARARDVKALEGALKAICDCNRGRETRPARPAITDKKLN
jgi:hypothetical protein